MFKNTIPEKVGIDSKYVLKYLKKLQERGLFMHSVVMARGNDIFCEAYWKPFNEKTLNRMYSTTKSYVGIGICELAAEGKLSLDDRIIDYFPDKLPDKVHPFFEAQTIRHMLTMQTCITSCNWFKQNITDRVKHYFHFTPTRYPGTGFDYDTSGSFVLGALIERVSGKKLIEYLREKCLDEIGFSKEAYCLKAPGGHTWGDSALLCTARDQLAFGRLLANGGNWNGKQLLNEKMVAEAISKHTDTIDSGIKNYDNMGYGFQIWRCFDDAFAFLGMHDQGMIYHPKTDIVFVYTAGNPFAPTRTIILENFYNDIIANVSDEILTSNSTKSELLNYCKELELITASGEAKSDFEEKINNKKFHPANNAMGITEFSLSFDVEGGNFIYVNEQGEKNLRFGRSKNVLQQFPQTGYSKDIGDFKCEGHTYRCAVSAGWVEETKLSIIVQIIDDYIGLLNITLGFNGDYVLLDMKKSAEYFLDEYNGCAVAKIED